MRLLIVSLFFMGIIMAIIGYYKANSECPLQKTKYKFIPRTLEEEQASNTSVYAIFKGMFEDQAPKDKM